MKKARSSTNWLDRAIGAVSPRAGLRRVKARAQFEAAKRAYDGAQGGRLTDGWFTSSSSADSENFAAASRLRDRSRDLVRNNPHAAKAVSSLVVNIIGEGIMPRPVTGDKRRDAKVKAAFDKWAKQCDADGQLDFYGLQTLACREMVEGGEVLARRRYRRSTDGVAVPVQIQILEADLLDMARNGPMTGQNNNNMMIQGVEFDQIGRRAAYWMFPFHPGNNFVDPRTSLISQRIDASDIAHCYEKQRTQVRGVPWGAPAIRKLRDFDDYDEAEIVRKKIEASTVAIVTADDDDEEGIAPRVTDSDGNIIEKFEPGLIAYARGGKEVRFNAPATIGGYAEYKQCSLHTISAGFRVPYELVSNDLSQVNYSSIRAGIVEFRRFVKQVQWQIFIPMFLEPIWAWFCEAAYLAGEIDSPEIPVEWAPPKFDFLSPVDDAQAEQITLRNGTRTWPEVVAEHGRNPDDVLDEIAAWNKRMDDLGITLDSDPRRTSVKGVQQKDQEKTGGDSTSLSQPN